MSDFDDEELNVHLVAIDVVILADEVVEHLPRGRFDRMAKSAMLIQTNRRLGKSGTGSGTGSGTR